MKLTDRLYELRYRARYLFVKRGRVAESTRYVYEDEAAVFVDADVPEALRHGEYDDLAGFASKAEFDEYWETEKPGSKKGHMSTWLHWTPLMATKRSVK